MLALAIANVMATNPCLVMPLNQLWRGSVALVVTTMFLGVSHAGVRSDYVAACPTEFINAWNEWDPTDPAKMPPLPEKPCLLIWWDHAYICSQENGGCEVNRE
jgi:hypothetical protein